MCVKDEYRKMDYRTPIDSFMPPEPQVLASKAIYLERLMEEDALKKRYKKAYEGVKF